MSAVVGSLNIFPQKWERLNLRLFTIFENPTNKTMRIDKRFTEAQTKQTKTVSENALFYFVQR